MAMDDFPDSDLGEVYVIQLSKEQWQRNQFVPGTAELNLRWGG